MGANKIRALRVMDGAEGISIGTTASSSGTRGGWWASLSLRTRLALYVVALALTFLACVGTAVRAWERRAQWEQRARRFQIENVTLAEEYKAAFLELNLWRLRYELTGAEAHRARFEADATLLARWLDEQANEVAVAETRDLLRVLAGEFAKFREQTANLFAGPAGAEANAAARLFARLDADSRPVLELETRLSTLQRETFAAFVTRMRQDLDKVWMTLFITLAALLLCVGFLARLTYRDYIAPLRRSVQQSQRLLERQEKLTALGRLTAGLAHEIRNPLNSIKARLFTQRRMIARNTPALEDNQFIDEEIDRLDGIVQEALQFARPGTPALQRARPAASLHTLCGLVEAALRRQDIQLVTDFASDPELLIDIQQLKQALLNLVNNAAESIGRGGTVTLRTRAATLRKKGGRHHALAIEIADTGPGVLPEARSRLFDPFFTTKENGTGLGLSTAARIVHAHGGNIECESTPGHGALFRILLPVDAPDEKTPHPAH